MALPVVEETPAASTRAAGWDEPYQDPDHEITFLGHITRLAATVLHFLLRFGRTRTARQPAEAVAP